MTLPTPAQVRAYRVPGEAYAAERWLDALLVGNFTHVPEWFVRADWPEGGHATIQAMPRDRRGQLTPGASFRIEGADWRDAMRAGEAVALAERAVERMREAGK